MIEGAVYPAELDYRFGWRCLLPLRDSEQVALFGFDDREVLFWKLALSGATVTDDAAVATVWVVQDMPSISISRFDSEHLHTICLTGSRSVVATWRKWMKGRFVDVRDYALLPPNDPRVVVPLGVVSDWVVQALALHRPGRVLARRVVYLLKVLVRVGFDLPLRSRMVCIARKSASVFPQGARQAQLDMDSADAPKAFALYLGTPDDNRKTVILPLGGTRQAILKCGASPKAQAALRNEAAALKALSQANLGLHVPALLDVVENGSGVTLHQEYRPRQRLGEIGLRKAAAAFLIKLSLQGRSARPLTEVIQQSTLLKSCDTMSVPWVAYAAVRDHLVELAAEGCTVWGYRSHGDFAPWNCAWTAKGFFVFDWEESRAWDVALGDAFSFVVAPAVHVTHSPNPQAVESSALTLALGVAKEAGLPVGDISIYWAYWLLQRMAKQPASLYMALMEQLSASWK
jgi:hypothetical protein